MKALWAQAAAETRLTLRRGESLLLTIAIPVGLLAFLSLTKVLPRPSDDLSYLVPGILALAIMSTGMVSLGIATAFEREYKVLKRLGATPLGRPRLVTAKLASVILVELLQAGVIIGAGFALGWHIGPSGASAPGGPGPALLSLAALAAAVAATCGFAGLGLLMAGRLRADIVLAVANGLWLALLLLGGMLFPLSRLPGAVRAVAEVLPASALAGALRASMGTGAAVTGHDWAVLGGWAVLAPVAAALSFRWE
ncbi:MAG: ABC transporter permease [Acidimicrobiales bacterium]